MEVPLFSSSATFTPTWTPTHTPSSSPTPSPATFAEVVNQSANLRAGPGTQYEIAGSVEQGERLPVYGRNENGSWLLLDADEEIWIWVSLVNVEEEIDSIPVPPSATPTNTPTITPSPTPTRTPNVAQTARAQANADATATIQAYVISPPVGTWCSNNSTRQVCVGDFRYTNRIAYTNAASNGRYVAFAVGVRNISSSNISANPNDFTLVMEDGRTYAYSAQSFSYWSQPLEHITIGPDNRGHGGIVFHVPNDVPIRELRYIGGFLESDIVIDLFDPPD